MTTYLDEIFWKIKINTPTFVTKVLRLNTPTLDPVRHFRLLRLTTPTYEIPKFVVEPKKTIYSADTL